MCGVGEDVDVEEKLWWVKEEDFSARRRRTRRWRTSERDGEWVWCVSEDEEGENEKWDKKEG